MASLLFITGFALLVMETFTGMLVNGSIVFINCIDWFRGRKLSPTDQILTCLSLSRVLWQTTVTLDVTMFSFFLYTYILNYGYVMTAILGFFTNELSLWLGAWLSVLYFVKIASFSHPVFLQLKLRFSGLVPWLLLSSVGFSAFVTTIAVIRPNAGMVICDRYKLLLNNSCDSKTEMPRYFSHITAVLIALDFLPFVTLLSSTILLIVSLWKHTRNLQHNGIGVRDLSASVHLTAIKVLASFAVLYLSGFIAVMVQTVMIWISKDHSWTSLSYYTVTALPLTVHAVILISINPKLKQAWVRLICGCSVAVPTLSNPMNRITPGPPVLCCPLKCAEFHVSCIDDTV